VCHLEIGRRRFHHRRAAHATVCQLQSDDTNSAPDIEDARAFDRPSAEFSEQKSCGRVGATATVAPQVALRPFTINLRLRSAILSAACHPKTPLRQRRGARRIITKNGRDVGPHYAARVT
jgi:hypothetical protein